MAHLVGGVYGEKYMPDSVTELGISLADLHTFGERRKPNHLGGGTRARGYRRAGKSDFCHRQMTALMI